MEKMEKISNISSLNVEVNIKKHMCEICEKAYTSKRDLKNHFIVAHEQKGQVYNCNICNKSFQHQKKLGNSPCQDYSFRTEKI